jgi:membrane fusion protein (multidrug efflux system)
MSVKNDSLRALVPLLASALLGLGACADPGPNGAQAGEKERKEAPSLSVTSETAEARRVERTVDFAGTLYANAEAAVAAEVSGRLVRLGADLGDAVSEGQLLAEIAGDELEARLREAEAVLAQAERDDTRGRELRSQGVISAQEIDKLTSALDVARARREVLALQVAKTKVRAPFAGRISRRMVDVGNFVRTGTPLFTLVADDPLRLRGEIPERFAAALAPDARVRGSVAAYPDETIEGRVTRISAAADPERRALLIEAEVPNPGGRLKPGFFCKAEVITETSEQATIVPTEALHTYAGVERVFVIDDQGIVQSRTVESGERLGPYVEIRSGVAPGERVATSALARLTDGARVTLRQAKTDTNSEAPS